LQFLFERLGLLSQVRQQEVAPRPAFEALCLHVHTHRAKMVQGSMGEALEAKWGEVLRPGGQRLRAEDGSVR